MVHWLGSNAIIFWILFTYICPVLYGLVLFDWILSNQLPFQQNKEVLKFSKQFSLNETSLNEQRDVCELFLPHLHHLQ